MISLFAGEGGSAKRDRLGDPLQVLDKHIDFAALAKAVEAKWMIGGSGRGAGTGCEDDLGMARTAEDARPDRGHQRGGGSTAGTGRFHSPRWPDHRRQRGECTVQRNTREEKQAIGRDEVPADWNASKRAEKDMDARWRQKQGRSYYGYRLHANMDRRWGFIRQVEVTRASVNDSTIWECLLDETNTNRAVYADRGYAKHARETELHVQGYRPCIQRKGTAQRPISKAQQRRHHRIARQRALGEHPFARWAQMGGKHLRTMGLARAKVVIGLQVITHNLMHRARLQQLGVVPA